MKERKKWRIWTAAVIFAGILSLTGCHVEILEDEKVRDVAFSLVDKDEIPEELKAKIEEEKESPMRLTYTDSETEGLYIVRGYGKQETSGYSIQIEEVYEGGNAVYVKTSLEGPGAKEKIVEKPTCPYAAIKIEKTKKQIIMD